MTAEKSCITWLNRRIRNLNGDRQIEMYSSKYLRISCCRLFSAGMTGGRAGGKGPSLLLRTEGPGAPSFRTGRPRGIEAGVALAVLPQLGVGLLQSTHFALNKKTSASIGAWEIELEIMTDLPTNQSTD